MPEDSKDAPPAPVDADVLFDLADLQKRGDKAGVEALQKAAAMGSASAQKALDRLQRDRPELFQGPPKEQPATASIPELPPPREGEKRIIISSWGSVAFQGFDLTTVDGLMEMIGFVKVYVNPELFISNLVGEANRRRFGGMP